MPDYPADLLPSSIFGTKSAPVLWIGSGISNRYVKGFMTWEDTLRSASAKMGINEDQFVARLNLIRNELGAKADEEDVLSEFALDLSSELNNMFQENKLNPTELFDEEQLKQYRHGVDPLKLLICSDLKSIEFKDEYRAEIELFRRLSESTPAVITTNYDYLVETLFDNKYKVYSNTDEYYFSDSVGLGEIYKIHGTVKRPSSIVINRNDYERFNEGSFVITSKIVSLLCESPLVILGYSMGDKIIRDMLGNMFMSFSKEKKEQLAKNILYVEYCPGTKPRKGTMQIESESGMFYINTLAIDNFEPLLKDLVECECALPVTQMRKIKRMISDIVFEAPVQGQRIAFVGIEGIDDVDPKRTVIAFATSIALQDFKAFKAYTVRDLFMDILDNNVPKIKATSIIDVWFEGSRFQKDRYIPLFHYLRLMDRDEQQYSQKLKDYIIVKRKQYDIFRKKKHSSAIDSVKSQDDVQRSLNAQYFVGDKMDLILLAVMNNWLTEEQALVWIKKLITSRGEDCIESTTVKRTITYLAFKDFE